MKLELSEAETHNLLAVLDAGVKALGAQSVLPLAPVLQKINAAQSVAKDQAAPEAE